MKNAKVKVLTDDRYMSFEGAVNRFLGDLDAQGYSYTLTFSVNGECFVAFIAYGK
jgi:hypothetical protein